MNHVFRPLPQSKAHRAKRGVCPSLSWLVCVRCGLVALANEATKRAMKRPCEGADDV